MGSGRNEIEKYICKVYQTLTYKNIFEGCNPNVEALSKLYKNICVFDSNKNSNDNKHTQHAKLIAIGSSSELIINDEINALEQFQLFLDENKGWKFGYLSYDLKNDIENLGSNNKDGLQFPVLHFFIPELVIEAEENIIRIHFDDDVLNSDEANSLYELAFSKNEHISTINSNVTIVSQIDKEKYIKTVNDLKQHISKGDIYEINLCQEFFASDAIIEPYTTFKKLNKISQAPFAAFCKFNDRYLISSSPERFLKKQENKVISQPIKGTIKRSPDKTEDENLKIKLRNDLKEQNENVMIVDLVRNDLSRIAQRGSVNVEELFEVYTFKQVHQLISTVSCELKEGLSFTDIIKATFPMGSMTGAPKIRAMELIEQYESTKRGLYSGAVGYISPSGDFDFSVVIRSILYNDSNKYLSFMVGSAITAKAEAEKEYEECMLKAKALFAVLENHGDTESHGE